MEQFLANGLCKGAIFATSAAGFYLIYRTTKVFHIAHAVVCAAATYFAYVCLVKFHFPLLLTFLATATATATLGLLIDVVVYRPLQKRNASSLVLLISSLGINGALTNCLLLIFGSKPLVFHSGPEPTIQLISIILNQSQTRQLLVFVPLAAVYVILMKAGPLGQLCTALADNSKLAYVLGVNVHSARAIIFAIGSAIASVASVLLALDIGTEPHFGFPLMLWSVAACIIGGLGWHWGPLIGGIALGLVQSLVAWAFASEWDMAATFILVIILLVVRKRDLFVIRRRPEEA